MPPRFDVLATYNAERSRGIMHTPEYDKRMAGLQADSDSWERLVLIPSIPGRVVVVEAR